MIYGIVFIGFKAKDGTILKFGYGYENEIVPEFKIPDDLADLLKVKKNRAEVISACFDDCGDSLMETMEAFSVPEYNVEPLKDYNSFFRTVNKLGNDEIDSVALGIVVNDHGVCDQSWALLDFENKTVEKKQWKDDYGPSYTVRDSLVDEAFLINQDQEFNSGEDLIADTSSDDFIINKSGVLRGCQSLIFDKEIVEIPEGIKGIGPEAFRYKESIRKVIMHEGIKEIGEGAFESCKNLEEIIIPSSVKKIGKGAFEFCYNLKGINIPEGIETIEEDTFLGCNALKTIIIPASVKSIESGAFKGCGAEEIKVPKLTEFIGINEDSISPSFSGNYDVIPDGDSPFYTLDDRIVYNKEKTEIVFVPQNISGDVNICAGVEIIADSAFSGREKIDTVTIPESVTHIGSVVFSSTSIKTIVIPDSVQSMRHQVCDYCRQLTTARVPGSVKVIDGTFRDCIKLTEVHLGEGLEVIGKDAFNKCKSLEEIIIPDGVIAIDSKAFFNCKALKSINIPDSVQQIHKLAFKGCDALPEGIIPQDLIVDKVKLK